MNGTATAIPTQAQVAKMARAYMDSHGLTKWQFGFNTNKRRCGVCKWRRSGAPGSIELSVHLLRFGWGQIQDTIKHEVAHALVGHRAKHGWEWQKKAVELGCRPTRCASLPGGREALVACKFAGTCPKCGKVSKRHKRSRTACGTCCKRYNGGRFTDEFLLEWERV